MKNALADQIPLTAALFVTPLVALQILVVLQRQVILVVSTQNGIRHVMLKLKMVSSQEVVSVKI